MMRSDGTGFGLTDDAHRDREPKWSPDGKKVGFYSDRSGEFQLWTVNADECWPAAADELWWSSSPISSGRRTAPCGRPNATASRNSRARARGRRWNIVERPNSNALQFSMLDGVAVVPNRGRRMDDSWH